MNIIKLQADKNMQEKNPNTRIMNVVSIIMRIFGIWIVFMLIALYKIATVDVFTPGGAFYVVAFASVVPMAVGIAMWIFGKDKYDSDGMIGYMMMWMQRILCLVALIMNTMAFGFLYIMTRNPHNCI